MNVFQIYNEIDISLFTIATGETNLHRIFKNVNLFYTTTNQCEKLLPLENEQLIATYTFR